MKTWRIKVTLHPVEDARIWDEITAKVTQGGAAGTVIKAMLAECFELRDFKILAMAALTGTQEGPLRDLEVPQPGPVRSQAGEDDPEDLDLMAGFLAE